MLSRSLAFLQRDVAQATARKNTAKAGSRLRTVIPTMQIYNLQPNPAEGSLTRITAESRGIRFSVLPQIGAPNTDPQDDTPQFDATRRAVSTFSPQEAGSMLAVLEGKIPSYNLESEYRSLSLTPAADGKSFALTGFIKRVTQDSVAINLKLEKANLAAFKGFVESSIVEGFGFHQYLNPPQKVVIRRYNQQLRELKQEQEREERRNNENRNNNNNRNRNRNNNNDNRNNNKNNNKGNNNNKNNKGNNKNE